MTPRRRWLLLHNAQAGQRDRARTLRVLDTELSAKGIDLEVAAPPSREASVERANRAARSGDFEAILAFGGDGTAATVAEGLAGTCVPLGVVPGGTVNVLAREFRIPLDPVAAALSLVDAKPRKMDVGRANGRIFLLMAGAGPDAEIMRDVPASSKRRLGRAAIGWTAVTKLLSGRRPRLVVEVDGESIEAGAAVVANARFYGGPFPIAPAADTANGSFDVVIFRGSRRRDFARYLAAIPRGAHVGMPDVEIRRATSVRLRAADSGHPVAVQLDGDYALDTPVDVAIEPGGLFVLVP